jgi:hypothetical protein
VIRHKLFSGELRFQGMSTEGTQAHGQGGEKGTKD